MPLLLPILCVGAQTRNGFFVLVVTLVIFATTNGIVSTSEEDVDGTPTLHAVGFVFSLARQAHLASPSRGATVGSMDI